MIDWEMGVKSFHNAPFLPAAELLGRRDGEMGRKAPVNVNELTFNVAFGATEVHN